MTPTEPTLPELPEGYRWFLKPSEDRMYVAIQREVGTAARRWEDEYTTSIHPFNLKRGLLDAAVEFNQYLQNREILLQWSGTYDSKGVKQW